jgi:hypothetical protein
LPGLSVNFSRKRSGLVSKASPGIDRLVRGVGKRILEAVYDRPDTQEALGVLTYVTTKEWGNL